MKPWLILMLVLFSLPSWGAARELSWQEMVPAGAPPPPPPMPIHDLSELGDVLLSEQEAPMPQREPAAPVVPGLDGQEVKLPGYIVPLEMSAEGRVIEFLLVPYFGACIHVPPPPSNQIVHVRSELGVLQDALYQPYWVEGPLRVQQRSSELAESGYVMEAIKIYEYELD
ncbi:DUF3299 domain-containing protein [Stutzerimonas tarimensis]|uniref:DUF3299 domain-containing protein n=1 Tax=Stutzerimonas tarimensis TaxID=1507735 RepID=A0ABV7T147_9GAMM